MEKTNLLKYMTLQSQDNIVSMHATCKHTGWIMYIPSMHTMSHRPRRC